MTDTGKPAENFDEKGGRQPRGRPPKRLIVFADGTGNAFGGQASNIWRIYDAVEKRGLDPDKRSTQLTRYIPGVGTSSIGLIRYLDGATGFGVPSNVRKLYRFLCWNWQPGDEIWMFGFSRGAFTVRTLASLIHSQGLLPREIGGRPVTTSEMRRNAVGAWRAYRQKTAPFRDPETKKIRMSPLVSLGRWVRDRCVGAKRSLSGEQSHAEVQEIVRAEHPEHVGGKVKIDFLGLFDTVEAYGVPLEEVRSMIDFWVWPISFRNRVCSAAVKQVRHALALDDERRTFHPLRFDQTPPADRDKADTTPGPVIKEVWFAGVHADIGGGYPDDETSLEPLIWMIREAEELGLEFVKARVGDWDERRSKNALIHDSRSGLKAAYRYTPRPVESGPAFGGKPVVHTSVADKITAGRDGYSPVMLTNDFLPHDETQQVALEYDTRAADQVKALVMWRRVANVAFITFLLLLISLPWTMGVIKALVQPDEAPVSAAALSLPGVVAAVVPGIAEPWLQVVYNNSLLSLPIILLVVVLLLTGAALRDRIKDGARTAWVPRADGKAHTNSAGFLIRSGGRLQASRFVRGAYTVLSVWVIPLALAFLIILAAVKIIHVAGMTITTATGNLCPEPTETHDVDVGETHVVRDLFSPRTLCWDSGVRLVEGRSYWLRLEELVPFSDNGQRVPISGFETNQRSYVFGKLIRRTGTSWFRPVAQIGRYGNSIVPLERHSGMPTEFLPDVRDREVDRQNGCEGVDAETEVTSTMTARFRAANGGQLYLYVNDRIFWPFMDSYSDNGGCARLTVYGEESPI